MKQAGSVMRLYRRRFSTEADREAFIDSVDRLSVRLSAADVSFRLFQSEKNPLCLTEIWLYPDRGMMEWVRSVVDSSAPLLTQFNLETDADTLILRKSFDICEDD